MIGGGPGGYVAAIRAAQLGAQVYLIESEEVGGICLNHGCIPSKTLIHNIEVMDLIRRSKEFGIRVQGEPEFDLAQINERKQKVIQVQVKGIRSLLKSYSILTIKGRGSVKNERTVLIKKEDGEEEIVDTDRIVLATGSVPMRPSVFPFEAGKVITSEEALNLKGIPKRMLIVGAGVEGSEFAFVYTGLGSDVTIVESKNRVLPGEDEDMSDLVQREMKKRGMSVYTGIGVKSVLNEEQVIRVVLDNGEEISINQVLVSVGRKPRSNDLGLDTIGIKLGARAEVLVNENMETSVPGIYAIGDMVDKMMLAHVASMEGKLAAWNALADSDDKQAMNYEIVPAGIFTIPEIGTVGLKDWQAAERGIKVRVGRFPYRALGRSHTMGEITGLVKVIAKEKDNSIIGVHILGSHASDLVHEAAMAMKFNGKADDISELIHAHPTFPEGLMEATEDVLGRAVHTLKR